MTNRKKQASHINKKGRKGGRSSKGIPANKGQKGGRSSANTDVLGSEDWYYEGLWIE